MFLLLCHWVFLTSLQYLERIKLIVANRIKAFEAQIFGILFSFNVENKYIIIKDNWSASDVMPGKMIILSEHLIPKN